MQCFTVLCLCISAEKLISGGDCFETQTICFSGLNASWWRQQDPEAQQLFTCIYVFNKMRRKKILFINFTMDKNSSHSYSPRLRGLGPLSNTVCLGSSRESTPNRTSICLAVSARPKYVTNMQIDRQTHRYGIIGRNTHCARCAEDVHTVRAMTNTYCMLSWMHGSQHFLNTLQWH